jgi:hypothetical protein
VPANPASADGRRKYLKARHMNEGPERAPFRWPFLSDDLDVSVKASP